MNDKTKNSNSSTNSAKANKATTLNKNTSDKLSSQTIPALPKVPSNPLIDQHPVDTLIHIQATLAFIQDYISKNTEDSDNTPHQARVHTGHHTLLRIVNDALDYEIDRLDKQMPLMVVQ